MPSALVVAVVATPVATFMMETVALGIAAWDSSVTVPERVAPTVCECAGIDARNQTIKTTAGAHAASKFLDLDVPHMRFIISTSPLKTMVCPSFVDCAPNIVLFSNYVRCSDSTVGRLLPMPRHEHSRLDGLKFAEGLTEGPSEAAKKFPIPPHP